MTICRPALYAILVVFAMTGAAKAQDRRQEIRSLLESRDAEIKRLLGRDDSGVTPAQKERLRNVINDVIDFASMAREALGPHWTGLGEARRQEFVEVFTGIVRNQSLANLDPYRAPVRYESITVDGERAHVATSTVYREVPMRVEYDLSWSEGKWRAVDIILDEVSTVDGYARSFQTLIRKRGFDELMSRLRRKLEESAD